jgi:orotate phosphoribosyltransferase
MTEEEARQELIHLLREHSLVLGEVTLSSGRTASYYIDARRTVMRPEGLRVAGTLIASHAGRVGATAVGGPVMAAIPLACAAISVPEGAELGGFFVRKERKDHGLQRWVEGAAEPGDRVLVVEDTVTTGGSTVSAIERIRDEGFEIAGVVCLVDRLAGGGDAIAEAAGAPFTALTTIDDIYPDRPDRND